MSASSETTTSPVAASSPCCSAHGLPTQPGRGSPRHHAGAVRARDRGGRVAGAVVDDDHLEHVGIAAQPGQARRRSRRSSSRAGITTLTRRAVRRGGERRPAAAAAREPGEHDGPAAAWASGAASPGRLADRSASVRLNSDVQQGERLGPERHPGAGRVPRQGAGVARGAQGDAAPASRGDDDARVAARRAWQQRARRGRARRRHLARRVRRRRPRAAPAGRGQPGDRARRRARDLRHHRRGHARPDADRARLGGAEAAPPRPDADGRRGLVPALLRAGRGLRPRRRADARQAAGGRLLAAVGPEGVDDERAVRGVRPAARPHEPRRAQAQGPDDVRRADGRRGRHGPPAAPDLRRGALQRGLLRRRPRSRRAPRSARSTAAGASA